MTMSELTYFSVPFALHLYLCTGSCCAADHPKSVVYTGYCTVSARIIFHNPRGAARLGDLKNNPLGTVQYPIHMTTDHAACRLAVAQLDA